MTTKQIEPDQGSRRDQERRPELARRRRIAAFAVAATIGVAAIALILVTRPGQNATTPADEPPIVNPVDATAEEVATSFVEAYGAFNADQAITYLADDAEDLGTDR